MPKPNHTTPHTFKFLIGPTLGIQINIRGTFINFGNFSHQYSLIWDRTFIDSEENSLITVKKFPNHIQVGVIVFFFFAKIRILNDFLGIKLPLLFRSHSCTHTFFTILKFFTLYHDFYHNFPACTIIWTRTFIVFSKFSSTYGYLDLYVYLEP